jgi:hypothetical protein
MENLMSHYTFEVCSQLVDQEAIVDLLFEIREELRLPDRQICQEIAGLCFAKGGVIAVYDGSLMVGMLGYFCGEPQFDYVNKETAFMYVAGIRDEYRLTRVFYKGLIFALQLFQKMGFKAIKLQAEATNPYTNKLYGRFAQPVAKSKSLRGKEVVTYGGSIEDALGYLLYGKRPLAQSADELLAAVV